MPYTVKSSEKLRKPGAESETKALLYLMNFRTDSDDIHYFIVDFFNDLTGMDQMSTKLWDLQSKGAHNVSPKAIGKELVTLFKNYMSALDFEAYILFIGSVTGALRIDSSLSTFNIKNVKDDAVTYIIEGLIEEGTEKGYIDNADLTDTNITSFLQKVVFVIDDDKEPSEYVKAIIKQHPNIVPEEKVLNAIFNEIRDTQASKKNISVVEGVVIETSDEALNYCRHLTNNEIRLLTLQRIINRDPLSQGISRSFVKIYSTWPPERQNDMLEDCQSSLCRALFNKNAASGFWNLFENTYNLIIANPADTVQNIFVKLQSIPNCINRCPDFDVLSLKYFISIVKDGIQK
ncbi:MAG: hypothetical protein ACRCU3_10450 [Eubacteriaceae bacterium]